MSKVRKTFKTKDGKTVSFLSTGKKKRKNPSRPLNSWQQYVQDNMARVINEYDVEAPEAMRILSDQYKYGEKDV